MKGTKITERNEKKYGKICSTCGIFNNYCRCKNKNMNDFKSRLRDEQTELREKVNKLENFLNSETSIIVEKDQIDLMNIQLAAMQSYLYAITMRLRKLG